MGILISFLLAIIAFYKHRFQYWHYKNVPTSKPSIPFGNSGNSFCRKKPFAFRLKRQYDLAKSRGWKHCGLYLMFSPMYLLVDLEYVKNILTKDFDHFVSRGFYYNEKNDPLSAHLFSIGGEKWRRLRTILTPTFTTGKMKMMFLTLVDCTPILLEQIDIHFQKNIPINIKELICCFTTDIIGSCAFGLDCETFKDKDSPFRKCGKNVFEHTSRFTYIIRGLILIHFPKTARSLGIRFFPREVTDFFMKVVKDTVQYREQYNVRRDDCLQILIDLKNSKSHNHSSDIKDANSLTIEEIAAQCFVFFLAGFETSSTTMTFALYELSKQPKIQEKVRQEINTVLDKYGGEMTYDAIQKMKYLEQIINGKHLINIMRFLILQQNNYGRF